MGESKKIFSSFSPSGLTDWQKTAQSELNGKDPWAELTRTYRGVTIRPYYDHGAAPALLHASENPYLGPRTWYNCPLVRVSDPSKSNHEALLHLQNGADGVLFELHEEADLKILCNNIDRNHASVNFLVSGPLTISPALTEYLKSRPRESVSPPIALFSDQIPELIDTDLCCGLTLSQSANVAEDIASFFSGILKKSNIRFSPAIRVCMDQDFFLSMATLRAVRLVWNEVIKAHSLPVKSILVLAHSRPWSSSSYDPHGNMLKGTMAGIAAVLGGCDILTIDAEEPPSSMTVRVARNISNILREESQLSRVADPVAGSYFVDQLTQEIASKAITLIPQKS